MAGAAFLRREAVCVSISLAIRENNGDNPGNAGSVANGQMVSLSLARPGSHEMQEAKVTEPVLQSTILASYTTMINGLRTSLPTGITSYNRL